MFQTGHPGISIIITAFREEKTIGRAIEALLRSEIPPGSEIIVVCPDDETANTAARFTDVRIIRDPHKGKPVALQLALDVAQHDLVVLTDGDVFVADGAITALIEPFKDTGVGASSGRPVSLSPRETMLGYWSHLLTDAGAHAERMRLHSQNRFFVCSGYLYAVRKHLLERVPEDALAEDAVISHMIAMKSMTISYVPEAEVYVLYPDTYSDWLKQKVRSAGGYTQKVIADSPLRMRSFRHEVMAGTVRSLQYAKSFKELFFTIALFAARIHLWFLIFWRVKVRKLPLSTLWQRVESTK